MVTDATMHRKPIATVRVKGSANTSTPTTMTVKGSRAPNMLVSVLPMWRNPIIKVRLLTAVGRNAKSKRLIPISTVVTG